MLVQGVPRGVGGEVLVLQPFFFKVGELIMLLI